MCFVCNQSAKMLSIDGYRICKHCETYIAKVLPDNREVQKVLEEHASLYILGVHETLDFHTHATRLAMIKKFSGSTHTILDFGCGKGNFVKFARAKGYKAFAYDKSESIKKHLFVQAIPFYKNLWEIPDNYFDVITCFDVIEHTTNPRFIIREMKQKLKKHGILVISTPNAQGLSAKILGKRWWVFGPAGHFILFSIYSLQLLLSNMGLKVLDINTDTLTPWFTPSEKLLSKILNKVIYLVLLPFQKLLFNNYLGDNIQLVARR